jgi:hypothetical protein
MDRSPSNRRPSSLSYIPFRSSPLATSSVTATIRRISETGEMEMEDAEEHVQEIEVDDLFTMDDLETVATTEDESAGEMSQDGLASIQVDAPFRAGTPTPAITPPTTARWPGGGNTARRPRNQGGNATANDDAPIIETYEGTWTSPVPFSMLLENALDGQLMEMDVSMLGDMIDSSHEISTDELDTECNSRVFLTNLVLDIRRRNFWNCWIRYLHRNQQQQGIYSSNIGAEWSDLLAIVYFFLNQADRS